MRLAWAITVHKSQGLTFNHVIIDFSGGAFAGGQTYVALSRCTSLDGIILKKRISRSDIFIKPEIIHFSQNFNNPRLIEQFDKDDFDGSLTALFEAIHLRYDPEKPEVKRLIRKKLSIITELKERIKTLEQRDHERRETLKKYAYEYYLLGNECITKAHDTRAALANFDKALALDPLLLDAWVRKGVTLMDADDLSGAAQCLNEAVRLSPLYFKALYNRGKLRYKLEDYEGASSDFLKAVKLKPQNATLHDRLGDTFSKLGEIETAGRFWSIAEEIRERKHNK